jgi:hypothetical protein
MYEARRPRRTGDALLCHSKPSNPASRPTRGPPDARPIELSTDLSLRRTIEPTTDLSLVHPLVHSISPSHNHAITRSGEPTCRRTLHLSWRCTVVRSLLRSACSLDAGEAGPPKEPDLSLGFAVTLSDLPSLAQTVRITFLAVPQTDCPSFLCPSPLSAPPSRPPFILPVLPTTRLARFLSPAVSRAEAPASRPGPLLY